MDRRSRDFFMAINGFNNDKLDTIDINHLTLEEILEKYNKYGHNYESFMKSEKGIENIRKSKIQKKEYDKMFMFWINPFHIALRNEIGRNRLPKQVVEKVTKDKGDKARLTQSTINKIKGKHIEKIQIKKYTVNRQKAMEEILKILQELKLEQEERDSIESKEENVNNSPQILQEIEKYTFETGPVNNLKSYVKKYKLTLKNSRIEHSIELYGDIDLNKFYNDEKYERVVLEAIEDLELENYLSEPTNAKNNDYIGYIGNFRSIVKDGAQIWQQEIRESDIDAIRKITELDEKYKMIALKKNNYLKLGDGER